MRYAATCLTALILFSAGFLPPDAHAQSFTIEDVLSPGYPIELVSAGAADRIAWIEYEEGKRNVYTAAAPDFEPVRLTRYEDDDGRDLTNLRISDDGSVVVFIRGHTPNRQGWIANPASNPRGRSERLGPSARTAAIPGALPKPGTWHSLPTVSGPPTRRMARSLSLP